MPNQGVKASDVLGQLAVGILASLDKAQPGLGQIPLGLALALSNPNRAAVSRRDGFSFVNVVAEKGLYCAD